MTHHFTTVWLNGLAMSGINEQCFKATGFIGDGHHTCTQQTGDTGEQEGGKEKRTQRKRGGCSHLMPMILLWKSLLELSKTSINHSLEHTSLCHPQTLVKTLLCKVEAICAHDPEAMPSSMNQSSLKWTRVK